MGRRILLTARWVIGHAAGAHVIHEQGVVVIENGAVLHVGPSFDGEVAERIDYGQR